LFPTADNLIMMVENKMAEAETKVDKRYRLLDLLRGVIVFFMIAAHAVYFFHNDTGTVLRYVEKFGNTIAFTTFLLVSGATAAIAYFSQQDNWPERRKRLFKRVRVLLIGYFVIAFVVFFADIVSSHGFAKLNLIADILLLRKLPSFAEFYIPFIVFPVIVALFPGFFRKVTKTATRTIITGLVIYLAGMLLYQISLPEILVPWKGLFVGAEGYYRFPIFQYFPLYLFGMLWGFKLLTLKTKQQIQLAEGTMLTAGLGLVFVIITFFTVGKPIEEIMKRWPPSIPFLMAGVFFAASAALLFYLTHQLKKTKLLRDAILVLGQNALGLALTHIFLLQIYSLSGGTRTGSIALYLLGFTILMVLSIALAAVIPFNFRFVLNLERGNYHEEQLEQETLVRFEEEASEYIEKDVSKLKKYFFLGKHKKIDERLIRKRHVFGVAIVLALTTLVVFPPIAEQYQMQKKNGGVTWYNNEFGWRKNLIIKNNESLAEIPKGNTVKFFLNHAELVTAKKAKADGSDLSVVYWNGKGYEKVLYSFSSSTNQATTALSIQLKERVKPGDSNTNYYLYYGNNLDKENNGKKLQEPSNLKITVTTGNEESFPLLLTVDRRWSLISDDPKLPKTLRITLQSDEDYSSPEGSYRIENTDRTGKLEKTGEKQWEGVIDVSQLLPGEYKVKAEVTNESRVMTSSIAGFYVSFPLYIAWTQDWEGYDVPDVYLAAITQVARDHGLVMTHFWNPRLMLTDTVSNERKEKLLDWVKTRENAFGESIQMHLHMFADFVSASGVEPKNTPNWGDQGDGYGSLTTNYSIDEMTRIIKKGLEIMKSSGFAPTIYRAGGWFANASTLKAVQNSGMLADSSGRTAYKFFSQKGPWNLSASAQPYYPNESDPNKSGNPALSILEIPNNGADSYWFSTEDMKNRFKTNYPGGILEGPRQITYLSHPHWFNKSEQLKVKGVFDLIDIYKYENDSGPALYVTLDEIYKVWKK
jgi:hypothetical protein